MRFLAEGRVVYGITTGFGAFKDKLIPPDQVAQLQRNIVMSHASGVGPPFETPVVRAMMLIRANTLAKGYSGIRQETLDLLLHMIERGVHPVVPHARLAGRIRRPGPAGAHRAGDDRAGRSGIRRRSFPRRRGLAPRRAFSRRAGREGRAGADQRHGADGRAGLAGRGGSRKRRRGGRHRRRAEPGGAARHAVGLRRAHPRRAPAPAPDRLRGRDAPAAGRFHLRPSPERSRRAGCLYPALHPASTRRMSRRHQIRALGGRDRAEQRDRQPADFLRGRRARSPSAAATSTASRWRSRSTTWAWG